MSWNRGVCPHRWRTSTAECPECFSEAVADFAFTVAVLLGSALFIALNVWAYVAWLS